MLIRDAEDEDWVQIWPFRRQIVGSRETYAWDPNTPEAQARTLWMGPGKRAYVAEVDGAAIGSACVAPN